MRATIACPLIPCSLGHPGTSTPRCGRRSWPPLASPSPPQTPTGSPPCTPLPGVKYLYLSNMYTCQICILVKYIYVKYVYLSNIDLLLHLLQIWSGRGDSIASSPARDPCQFQNDSGGVLFSERVTCFHQGSSPLLVGAKYGNVEAVKLLLKDERVDVALQDNQGRSTPS